MKKNNKSKSNIQKNGDLLICKLCNKTIGRLELSGYDEEYSILCYPCFVKRNPAYEEMKKKGHFL